MLFAASAVVAGIVGWLDFITGPDFSFLILYLVPICYVTWQIGARAGLALALPSSALWLIAELFTQIRYTHALAPYWNAFSRLFFFLTCVFLISWLRKTQENLKRHATALEREMEDHYRTHQIVVEHEQLLVAMTEAAVDLMVVLDRHGYVLYGSPSYSRIFPSNPGGREYFFKSVAENDRLDALKMFRSLLQSQIPHCIDYSAIGADGRTYSFESQWSFSPATSPEGPKVVIVARDVTERRRAEVIERDQKGILEMLVRGDSLRQILGVLCACLQQWSRGRMLPAAYVADDAGAHFALLVAPAFEPCEHKLPSTLDLPPDVNVSVTKVSLPQCLQPTPLRPEHDALIDPRLVSEMKLAGLISMGIRSAKELTLARLDFYFREISELAPADRALLERVGSIAATVIERYTLLNNLTRLTHARLSAQEAERRRVARDLHDVVNQMLSTVSFRMAGLRERIEDASAAHGAELGELQSLLGRTAHEVTRISENLRPSELEVLGFIAAIRCLGADFQNRTGVQVLLDTQWLGRFDAETELMLYRIVQEALNNVEKHAGAKHVWLRIGPDAGAFCVTIRDDGRGGEEPRVPTVKIHSSHMGIIGMRERAELLGATLDIDMMPGHGTTISLRLPAPQTSEENDYGENREAEAAAG